MTTAVIELNDSALRLTLADGTSFSSPGYAVVVDDHVHIGDDARRRSRLYPLSSYNEFWHALSEQPLRKPTRHYRHHADLAFAHLQRLHELAGRPSEVLFAVPGDLSRDRLGLLLGLTGASRFRAVGLTDMAVAAAAASAGPGNYSFIDLQLHRAVITRLRVDDEVTRESVTTVPGVGWQRIRDVCASAVTDAFIRTERFDPRAEAATEQALYDYLDVWLESLATHESVALEMEFRGIEYRTQITRTQIARLIQSILDPVRTALGDDRALLLGHALATLPGAKELLATETVAAPGDIATACLAHETRIRRNGEPLAFVARLPATSTPRFAPRNSEPKAQATSSSVRARPTHLLAGSIATAVSGRTRFLDRSGMVTMRSDGNSIAEITDDSGLHLRRVAIGAVSLNGRPVVESSRLELGDLVRCIDAAVEYRVIAVDPVDGS